MARELQRHWTRRSVLGKSALGLGGALTVTRGLANLDSADGHRLPLLPTLFRERHGDQRNEGLTSQ